MSKTTFNSPVLAAAYQHAVRLEEESRYLKEYARELQAMGEIDDDDADEMELRSDNAHDEAVEILQIIREAD